MFPGPFASCYHSPDYGSEQGLYLVAVTRDTGYGLERWDFPTQSGHVLPAKDICYDTVSGCGVFKHFGSSQEYLCC